MPAGTPSLRRDQPYGTIHPPHNGASISQWGCLFDHGGTFLGFEDEVMQEKWTEEVAAARRENRSANLAPSDPKQAGQQFAPGAVDTEAERALELKERENAARREALALEREEIELAERKAKIKGDGGKGDQAERDRLAKEAAEAEAKRKKDAEEAAAAASKSKPADEGAGDADKGPAVDLIAWAKKEAEYPWFKVKAAAQEQYSGIIVTNTKSVVDGLVSRGALTADEVKR